MTRLLGQGGFGVVYEAFDELLERTVALKIARVNHVGDEQRRALALREAKTVAQLNHQGIVRVYDVGVDETTDECYIAMEFVQGQTLETLMRQARLSPPHVARIVAQIARALHHAHLAGFVHRDVKPSNVLIEKNGTARVADFGIALHELQQRGAVGQFAGTPSYMSPEQIRGDSHRLDGRADIWSLGVVLYEALCGRRPFQGDDADLRADILERDPKPPRQIDDGIPETLERVTLRCLSRSVTSRYPTALDLAVELETWLKQNVTSSLELQDLDEFPTPARNDQVDTARNKSTRNAPHFRKFPRWAKFGAPLVALGLLAIGGYFGGLFGVDGTGEVPAPRTVSSSNTLYNPLDRALETVGFPAGNATDEEVPAPRTFSSPQTLYNLLDRAPEPVVLPAEINSDVAITDPRLQKFAIVSEDLCGYSFGSSPPGNFRVKTVIHKNAYHGACGFFFGLRRDPNAENEEWTCHAVVLVCFTRAVADEVMRVERHELRFERVNGRLRRIDDRSLTSQEIPLARPATGTLEVRVVDGFVLDIAWNGNSLHKLTTAEPILANPPQVRDGQFGIVNFFGPAVCREAQLITD